MNEEFSKSLKNGDLNAYNKLFNTYYSRLFNYALKLSNDKSVAKDVVQEAFIKLWLSKQNIKPDLSIGNYLLKICHNEFLIHARKRKKERALLDKIKIETTYEMFTSNEDEVSRIDMVKEGIDKLSPKCKEAFILSKYEKMKYKVIAEKMGISIKTVENHISKAYSELRKNLQHLSILFF
ncbi:RNA polymerase sigma-70 factor [Maribacter sp.]|uniref:RNA polymerase sigma factor n=1 Tax=Maribacter sp. TaxID=1897614 RepID=UPI0025B95F73|nr:RNA polymerase sigma-70 factor [Maribacter sp.]